MKCTNLGSITSDQLNIPSLKHHQKYLSIVKPVGVSQTTCPTYKRTNKHQLHSTVGVSTMGMSTVGVSYLLLTM